MRELMIVQGRPRRVDHVDRGAPLVMSEEAWRDRMRQSMAGQFKIMATTLVLAGSLPILVIGSTLSEVPPDIAFTVFLPMLLCIILSLGGSLVLIYFIFKRRVTKGPIPGVYEHGIQFLTGIFVPYHEISEVEESKRIVPFFTEFVHLRPRAREGTSIWRRAIIPSAWIVRISFLTKEGLIEVERRVQGLPLGPSAPPKLVIYGPSLADRRRPPAGVAMGPEDDEGKDET